MCRKYPGNDFETRCVYSRWRNADNDSADVTSAGKSFQIRGPTIEKARLATVDRMTGGTTRRLWPAERSDRRPGRSHTRLIGPRSVQDFVCQDGDLELKSLLHVQPVETD